LFTVHAETHRSRPPELGLSVISDDGGFRWSPEVIMQSETGLEYASIPFSGRRRSGRLLAWRIAARNPDGLHQGQQPDRRLAAPMLRPTAGCHPRAIRVFDTFR
jgi:hypothetical protein